MMRVAESSDFVVQSGLGRVAALSVRIGVERCDRLRKNLELRIWKVRMR